MAKLIFLLDGNLLREFTLGKERMTIGRRSSNDIHVDNLAISGSHAEIIVSGKQATLVDLKSTNGTLVNDAPVSKHLLQHNDVIGLGKYQLKYIDEPEAKKPEDAGFADTVMINPNEVKAEEDQAVQKQAEVKRSPTPIQMTDDDAPEPLEVESKAKTEHQSESKDESIAEKPAAEAAMPENVIEAPKEIPSNMPRLQVLSGDNAGDQIILNRAMVKVGTQGKQLAVITKRGEEYFISHVAGDVRPLINDEMIGVKAHPLEDHDVIQVEDVKMEFHSK